MIKLIFFLFLLAASAYAQDFKLFEQKQQTLEERRARMNAEFRAGQSQVDAGTLRMGLATQGLRDVEAEEAALKRQIEEAKKKAQVEKN